MKACNLNPQCSASRPNVAAKLKALRQHLGLSQAACAQTFGLSVGTVRDWEQDRCRPERATRVLLQVIAHNPEVVKQALRTQDAAF
jgi:DNA-binding transcriptional regulator YiaG